LGRYSHWHRGFGVDWVLGLKCTRPSAYTSANIEERAMSGRTMTGTDVRAVFQSGEIDPADHPRPASLASVASVGSVQLASPTVPDGWKKMFEEKSGHYYYYNTKTGESRWDLPQHPA
jgi:hypothetical protein